LIERREKDVNLIGKYVRYTHCRWFDDGHGQRQNLGPHGTF